MPSPTELTLKRLRKHGWVCQVVEQTIRAPGMIFHRDLWGCLDILAIRSVPRPRILGIQACVSGDVRRRIDKAIGLTTEFGPSGNPRPKPDLAAWLGAGGEFQVWGWGKYGARGKRKLYECRRIEVVLEPSGFVEYVREPAAEMAGPTDHEMGACGVEG